MKTMRIAAASVVAVMMGLGLTGCGHSRNDDADDDVPTFDQVGEMRVYNDRPKVATIAPRARSLDTDHGFSSLLTARKSFVRRAGPTGKCCGTIRLVSF